MVGVVAVSLLLAGKSGNLGDNPLFEPLLLDRLIAFSLGWLALALAIEGRRTLISASLLGLAAFVHPSLGVQLAMLWSSGWLAWGILTKTTGVRRQDAARAILACGLCLSPALIFHARLFRADLMFGGASCADYLLIAASIQSPQHMLPHLWRFASDRLGMYGRLGVLGFGETRIARAIAWRFYSGC